MSKELSDLLIKAENQFINSLQKNDCIISETDMQAVHYSILNQCLDRTNYAVSTEWSIKEGKFGQIDLVVFEKSNAKEYLSWKNRKEYYCKVIPYYLVEYKNDFANTLSNKQIESLRKQVIRINDIASKQSSLSFRGLAVLLHGGEVYSKELIIGEFLEGIQWSENLDFRFIFYNINSRFLKIWDQVDGKIITNVME